jgi:hypothetical protein
MRQTAAKIRAVNITASAYVSRAPKIPILKAVKAKENDTTATRIAYPRMRLAINPPSPH